MPLVMGTGGQGMSHAPRAPHAPRDTGPHPRKARLGDRGDDAKATLHLSRRPGSNDRRRQQPHSARSARVVGGSGGGAGGATAGGVVEGPSAAAVAHHHHHQQQQHHGHGHGHAPGPPPPPQQQQTHHHHQQQQQQPQQQQAPQFQQGVEPITAPKALARFGEQLSAYEASEVLEYTSVYYCGSSNKLPAPVSGGVNHGYVLVVGEWQVCGRVTYARAGTMTNAVTTPWLSTTTSCTGSRSWDYWAKGLSGRYSSASVARTSSNIKPKTERKRRKMQHHHTQHAGCKVPRPQDGAARGCEDHQKQAEVSQAGADRNTIAAAPQGK